MNNKTPFKYHVISRKCKIFEQTVQWEQQGTPKHTTQ